MAVRLKLDILRVMDHLVGYDYGTKPKVMIVGDVEFPSLLGDKFLALAYAVEPQFRALVNAAMLVLVFENEATGRKCFARSKGWCEASGSGDAVALGFVELGSDEYVMCVYPEHERLLPAGLELNALDKGKSFSRTRCRPVSENLDLLIHRPESCVDLRA